MNNASIKIALIGKNAIFDNNETIGFVDDSILSAVKLELYRLGFYLTEKAEAVIKGYSKETFETTLPMIYEHFTNLKGVGVFHKPLFTNFPNIFPDEMRIAQASSTFNKSFTDFLNNIDDEFHSPIISDESITTLECGHQISTYLNHDNSCPLCENGSTNVKVVGDQHYNSYQSPMSDKHLSQLIAIDAINTNDIDTLVSNVISSNSALSSVNNDILELYIENTDAEAIKRILPEQIPFKEVVSHLTSLLLKSGWDRKDVISCMGKYFKTAKDVMRLAEDINRSDIPEKFVLPNKDRKLIVELLSTITNPDEDMVKEREKWVTLNMAVHFGTFKKKYPTTFESINRVLNRPETIKTFESKLEAALTANDITSVLSLLKSRPGVFARNMDHIVRKFPENVHGICEVFKDVGHTVSKRVLVTLYNNFKTRLNGFEGKRMFVNKRGFTQNITEPRGSIDASVCKQVFNVVEFCLMRSLKINDSNIKTVWIDPVLYDYKVPLRMRSTKNTLHKAERGSIIDYSNNPNTDVMRMFIYWKENSDSGRVDLDLSALFLTDSFDKIGECAYYDLYNDDLDVKHSGDITSAPNGASEFIDVNLMANHNVRYVVMYVNSFTNQSFDNFDAFCGVMFLNKNDVSTLYQPENVTERFDLTNDAKSVLCYIYDMKDKKMIWADMSRHTASASNLSSEGVNVMDTVKYLINESESSLSLGRFMELYAHSNNIVLLSDDEKDRADLVIDNTVINDTDTFTKQWLS